MNTVVISKNALKAKGHAYSDERRISPRSKTYVFFWNFFLYQRTLYRITVQAKKKMEQRVIANGINNPTVNSKRTGGILSHN